MGTPLELQALSARFAVVRLPAGAGLPWWAARGGEFLSLTRTPSETSVVCEEQFVPAESQAEHGFRALRVKGPLAFHLTGILATLAAPLSDAGVPIFVVSTFDTDYVLVRERNFGTAVATLKQAGHSVDE
jgi:hypothetical protein